MGTVTDKRKRSNHDDVMLAETAFKANERIRGNNGREYQILGNGAIKQGGFASIYKAHASSDNVGLVAIKAINLDNRKIRRSEHEKRIQSEVKIHKGWKIIPALSALSIA